MTVFKTICPTTKKEIPAEIDIPVLDPAIAAYGRIAGYTFTLDKCPYCGETHAWESADAGHCDGTLATVWTVQPPRPDQIAAHHH